MSLLKRILFGTPRHSVADVAKIILSKGDKVYVKNEGDRMRVTKTLNPAARREVKRQFVLQHWELMTAAVKEHKADSHLRMSYPTGSKRKEAVNGLRQVLQYAPSSVDFDIFNTLQGLYKEERDRVTVTTQAGQWRPKKFHPKPHEHRESPHAG